MPQEKSTTMHMKKQPVFPGFTLPEMILTVGLFSFLLLFVTVNLVGVKQKASLNTSTAVFIGDLKQQKIKAMVGDTEGRVTPDHYGVHFESDEYILFHGATYNAADSANFSLSLGDNITFLGSPSDLIFSRVSGEPIGGQTTITIRDNTTGLEKDVTINRYGVVTAVN